jgi:tRNA(fMet)-specific endonuclease VapC
MKKYLLDTNICIHYLKNEYNIVSKIKSVGFEHCYISELTLMELLFGAENNNEEHKDGNKERVKMLEHAMSDRVIPIREAFEVYAVEKTRLKRSGNLIGEIDLLIASSAIKHKLILVTRNVKHFERVANIVIENWIDAS